MCFLTAWMMWVLHVKPGHESVLCTSPKSVSARQCYSCGGVGHIQSDCMFSGPGLSPCTLRFDLWHRSVDQGRGPSERVWRNSSRPQMLCASIYLSLMPCAPLDALASIRPRALRHAAGQGTSRVSAPTSPPPRASTPRVALLTLRRAAGSAAPAARGAGSG
jgi:hypothetical protein